MFLNPQYSYVSQLHDIFLFICMIFMFLHVVYMLFTCHLHVRLGYSSHLVTQVQKRKRVQNYIERKSFYL